MKKNKITKNKDSDSNSKKNIAPLEIQMPSFVSTIKWHPVSKNKLEGRIKNVTLGYAFVLGLDDRNQSYQIIENYAEAWQIPFLKDNYQKEILHFTGPKGPVWIFCHRLAKGPYSHQGKLEESSYAWHRDQVSLLLGYAKSYNLKQIHLEFIASDINQEFGVLVGLELSAYNYKNLIEDKKISDLVQFSMSKSGGEFDKSLFLKAQNVGQAVNWARHLVNTPPNELNPKSISDFVKKHFSKSKKIKLDIWNEARLKKEKMGLHLAVGQGSKTLPCMIHLKYRPQKKNKKLNHQPIAFVGKGVTFDTGGLDIKPSSGMRLMKKDMGGAASLAGLAFWLEKSELSLPVDIYLGMAENSVDSFSMRPSDVVIARNGMKVEVTNTDAEGRMVLADVLDVAVTQKGLDEPQAIIDVATLTGAIKVGLGADIAGLFSNHDELAEELNTAGSEMGELSWRMPLYSKYTRGMDSAFADIVNSVEGFGGAITAALFLEKFIQKKPWAHLDIYSWNDKTNGALTFSGGNGQPVQTLISYLMRKDKLT